MFWGECALAAAHLIKCMPSTLLHEKTPFECLFGQTPLPTCAFFALFVLLTINEQKVINLLAEVESVFL